MTGSDSQRLRFSYGISLVTFTDFSGDVIPQSASQDQGSRAGAHKKAVGFPTASGL